MAAAWTLAEQFGTDPTGPVNQPTSSPVPDHLGHPEPLARTTPEHEGHKAPIGLLVALMGLAFLIVQLVARRD